MSPGTMQLTQMPAGPYSLARLRAVVVTAPLDVAYGKRVDIPPDSHEPEDMMRMRPWMPSFLIASAAMRVHLYSC
jgi:hypothetical protein